MALIGVYSSVESTEIQRLSLINSLTRPKFSNVIGLYRNYSCCDSSPRKDANICCSASKEASSRMDSVERASVGRSSDSVDDELSHVIKFRMSDFKLRDQVSIGHSGKADELVFEAIVKDPDSPLYNSNVVLRRLVSAQAKRRGKRAIEVLKRLARHKLLYHSYSMQVHGYVCSSTTDNVDSFTLVHGYHGSFSLRHWLQQSDWLPTLEATVALDEESVRRVGDSTIGGPRVSRKLRLIRILMRDLLIGVNYLHNHGLAHTELRLENLHVSPVDGHVKVGILGNAADFYKSNDDGTTSESNVDRRNGMIAFDMRCLGFIMAKMVLRELMDPLVFGEFKSFLTEGNHPSCLREFMLPTLSKNSTSGNIGLQILDRNWGAGWHLLSVLLASKPSERISCLSALRHPFLCGPRWRIDPSMNIIRWSLGSTTVRITEEYIYGRQQRSKVAHFIELMEMLNPHPKPRHWLQLFLGKWRLLYSTGRHIGLTLRQPDLRVLVGDVHLTISKASNPHVNFSALSTINFSVMVGQDWAHDKTGVRGNLQVDSTFRLRAGRRLYVKEDASTTKFTSGSPDLQDSMQKAFSNKRWSKVIPFKEFPSSLPVAKLVPGDIGLTMNLDKPLGEDVQIAQKVIQEIRTQIPPEMFDLSKMVCGTYLDNRLLILRGVNGSALVFTRSCSKEG